MPSHVTRNALDDPKNSEICYTLIQTCLWSKPEVSIFKNGRDMANIIIFMFCDIT